MINRIHIITCASLLGFWGGSALADGGAAPQVPESRPAPAKSAPPTSVAASTQPEVPPQPLPLPPQPVPADQLGVPTTISDPSGKALTAFYASLRETEQGHKKTRIIVYGASHVAGDGFTSYLRRQFQGRFGDAGGGFVVPAPPWNTFRHRDLNISFSRGWRSRWHGRSRKREDGLYGLAGVSFFSSNPGVYGRVETSLVDPFNRQVSTIEVYYWIRPEGGTVDVVIDDLHKDAFSTRGASPGPGYKVYKLPDGPHSIELRPHGDGEVMLFGVAFDREKPGVVLDAMGINGARASAQIDWDEKLHTAHLRHRDPDLVMLAYGTNACGDRKDPIEEYEARLDKVVQRIRSAVPRASCLLIGPSDWPIKQVRYRGRTRIVRRGRCGSRRRPCKVIGLLPRPRQDAVIDSQRKIAHRNGCGYWDWRWAMGGPLSMRFWRHSKPALARKDYLHHTWIGYQKIGAILWDSIMGDFN